MFTNVADINFNNFCCCRYMLHLMMRRPSFQFPLRRCWSVLLLCMWQDGRFLRPSHPNSCFRIAFKFCIRTDLEVLKRLSKTAFRNSNLFRFYGSLKLTEYAPRTRISPDPDTFWVNFGTWFNILLAFRLRIYHLNNIPYDTFLENIGISIFFWFHYSTLKICLGN